MDGKARILNKICYAFANTLRSNLLLCPAHNFRSTEELFRGKKRFSCMQNFLI